MKQQKKKWMLLFLSMVLVFSFTLAGCGGKDQGEEPAVDEPGDVDSGAEAEQVLHVITTDEPLLDPQRASYTIEFDVINAMMEGLLRLDQESKPAPGIAEDWEISEDGMVWTFYLRDANWSDGTAVTAQDFVYGWNRAIDPVVGSIYASIVEDHIKSAEAIDEKTLKVELLNPAPYFDSLMAFQTFFPAKEEFVEAIGEKYGTDPDKLLYNGPFKMVEWEHNNRIVLAKNEEYWDADTVKLEELSFDIVKDSNAGLALYEEGTVDRVTLTREQVPLFQDHEEFLTKNDPIVFYMLINTENDVLANTNIRKALSYGFNRQSYCDVILNDGSTSANGLIPAEVPGPADAADFRSANGDLVSYDLEQAKQFLAKGMEELGLEKLPPLRYLGYDHDTGIKGAEFVKENYAQLGIDIVVENLPIAAVKEKRKTGDFDLFFGGWGPDYWDPMTFMDLFVTDGPFNEGKWSNPAYDEKIQFAKTTFDAEKRMESLVEAERILIQEDAGIAPVYFKSVSILQKTYVKNLITHPFGAETEYKWVEIEGK